MQGDFALSLFEDGVLPAAFMIGLLGASLVFAQASKTVNGFRLIGWCTQAHHARTASMQPREAATQSCISCVLTCDGCARCATPGGLPDAGRRHRAQRVDGGCGGQRLRGGILVAGGVPRLCRRRRGVLRGPRLHFYRCTSQATECSALHTASNLYAMAQRILNAHVMQCAGRGCLHKFCVLVFIRQATLP